tara:strand:- start:98 stop:355 length:258 start_codon:yes stop_codon:yes gene_type:complete
VIEIKPKDLDKILLVMKYMMDERPDLNEKLMDFYCYLQEMKSNDSNDSNDRKDLKRIIIEESKSIDMNLDEMIWNLGMSLPSWNN